MRLASFGIIAAPLGQNFPRDGDQLRCRSWRHSSCDRRRAVVAIVDILAPLVFNPAPLPPAGFRDSLRSPSPSDLPMSLSLPNTPAEELRTLGLGRKSIPRNPCFDPLFFPFPSCPPLIFLRMGTEGDFLISKMRKGRGVRWLSFW